MWQEIKNELHLERVEPVSPDRECIDKIINILQEKAIHVAEVQVFNVWS